MRWLKQEMDNETEAKDLGQTHSQTCFTFYSNSALK